LIQNLKDEHWKKIKSDEITGIIAACAGLYLEAVAEKQEATIGENVKLKLEAINRSTVPITLVNYTNSSKTTNEFVPIDLQFNILNNLNATFLLAENLNYTQPYWLKEIGSVGMYHVDEQQNRGIPDVIREVKVVFDIKINNTIIPFERNVIYKFNDEVKGEVYKPFDIIPAISISFLDKVKIFTNSFLIQKVRENILELLLINHPLDCPICDQGGECDLQDQAKKYGTANGRLFQNKRFVSDKYFNVLIKSKYSR
jgi:hypothetical protein